MHLNNSYSLAVDDAATLDCLRVTLDCVRVTRRSAYCRSSNCHPTTAAETDVSRPGLSAS